MTNGTPVVINYTISGDNFSDISGSVSAVVGQKAYIIFDIDPNNSSGPVMDSILNELGYAGDYYTSFSPMIDSLSNYASAFVFAGVYSSNTVIDQTNGGKLASWCTNNGGMLYLEGGDMWYYDPQYNSGYDFSSLCGINATDDGSSDLATIGGVDSTFTEGMSFGYSGENSWIDHIDAAGSGFVIFSNSSPIYNCGVANDAGSYRTVGMSFEFGGLTDGSGVSTKSALADSIMHFFGLEAQGINEHSLLKSRARQVSFGIRARGSNIVKGAAEFSYGLTKSGKVEVSVYDASGRMVKRLVRREEKSGYHTVSWDGRDGNGKNVRRGIYFVRLSSSGKSKTAKLLLMR
ncbi:MAG: T9SS type A sorting domain-containing protein [Proteobacteria bacterium]|nr:T9SS type A sorting domain-containing protein [Pseudomonadota bacterium]